MIRAAKPIVRMCAERRREGRRSLAGRVSHSAINFLKLPLDNPTIAWQRDPTGRARPAGSLVSLSRRTATAPHSNRGRARLPFVDGRDAPFSRRSVDACTVPLGSQLEHAFSLDPSYRVHDVGHAEYLAAVSDHFPARLRRRPHTKTAAKVWIPADERWRAALVADGFDCVERDCASDGKGRIITLQAMPEFRGKRAYSVSVKTVDEALAVAARLR